MVSRDRCRINGLGRAGDYGRAGTPHLAAEGAMLRCTLRAWRMARPGAARCALVCVSRRRGRFWRPFRRPGRPAGRHRGRRRSRVRGTCGASRARRAGHAGRVRRVALRSAWERLAAVEAVVGERGCRVGVVEALAALGRRPGLTGPVGCSHRGGRPVACHVRERERGGLRPMVPGGLSFALAVVLGAACSGTGWAAGGSF